MIQIIFDTVNFYIFGIIDSNRHNDTQTARADGTLRRREDALSTLMLTAWNTNRIRHMDFILYSKLANIRNEGYPGELHNVTTDDGYILELHRIPNGKAGRARSDTGIRPVVLCMHGLLSASNAYIYMGSEYSIAYIFADAGFDVWLGNARGNKNSRRHVTLDPDDREERISFYDFTWEDIGINDLASMIDYILDVTGRDKLHYVGHSQGGTAFFVLMSLRPEYNEKIVSSNLLAGVGYMNYFPNPPLQIIARMSDELLTLGQRLGIVELFPPTISDIFPYNSSVVDYCAGDFSLRDYCYQIGLSTIMQDLIDALAVSAGAGVKQIAHFGQNVRDRKFRRWHYGTTGNLVHYGSEEPPEYDLRLITCKMTMHYSMNDNLLHENDVLAMAEQLPNTQVRRVARLSFEHSDYTSKPDSRELVTEFMVESIIDDEKRLAESENGLPGSAASLSLSLILRILTPFLLMFCLYN